MPWSKGLHVPLNGEKKTREKTIMCTSISYWNIDGYGWNDDRTLTFDHFMKPLKSSSKMIQIRCDHVQLISTKLAPYFQLVLWMCEREMWWTGR